MAHIELENVSLRYPLFGDSAKSLRAVLAGFLTGKRLESLPVHVEALTGITLELSEGSRLGLIGSNGAGKSSLLRLMAGVFQPSSGTVHREGKIVTMFDLSYGMDEEASGLDNINIVSSVLGISNSDLDRIKREVVDFSELGGALRRPIKTYSAGMRVRLAFGLVSSIYAEILLIDEIIGVGDASFMRKASARISKQIQEAKVLVLASHAESVLRDFCTTGLVMSDGKAVFYGPIDEALKYYNSKE